MSNSNSTNDIGAARFYGFSFITTFLAYGVGNALMEGVVAATDPIAALHSSSTTFLIAIILMIVVHTFTNMGVAVVMYTVLKPFSRFLPMAFLALAIIATTALMVGGGLLALALPVSGDQALEMSDKLMLVELMKKANFYLYQTGMTVWGVGGILMCFVLLRAKLVPSWLPYVGILGYAIFIIGTTSEFFGSGIGIMLSLPGGLFEITLSVYLIIKGFDYRHAQSAA